MAKAKGGKGDRVKKGFQRGESTRETTVLQPMSRPRKEPRSDKKGKTAKKDHNTPEILL